MNRADRTQHIIDRFRGTPQEFGRLQGLLCADHGLALDDPLSVVLREHVDTLAIARRMDEINREALASMKD